MSEPLRVEVVRSGTVESVHLVDVAVCDLDGRPVAHAGDPDRPAAFRSSAKPLQAAVSRASGWEPAAEEHLAIACASHSGEKGHIETVREILAGAGLEEDHLRCPDEVPDPILAARYGLSPRGPVAFNCSGKHAAMLAACVASDLPVATYRETSHPLQARMLDAMEAAAGMRMPTLVDGCGVPTPVGTLAAFARAFATISGTPEAAAMRAHPWLVGGTARLDTDLMTHLPVVAKAGAEGLNCVVAGGLSIALKSRDGLTRHSGPAVLFALTRLGATEVVPEALASAASPAVTGGGVPVGELRVAGELTSAG